MKDGIILKKNIKLSRPDYFQGILQLREIDDNVLEFVHDQISKRNDVAITRTVKLPNGVDLYVTSQKYIRTLGKKLMESFGGELKISSKLHTTNRQGKELYRVNVLFKLPRFKIGDIVNVKGEQVKLIRLGRRIFAKRWLPEERL